MKKKYIYSIVALAVVLLTIIIYSVTKKKSVVDLETEVKRGKFEILINVTGELQARNSVNISAPISKLRDIWVWNITIGKIVPEGSLVDSGDFVAQLDQTEIENQLKEKESEIEKNQAEIEKARIDSSLELRSQRDNIINLKFSVEEAEINLEQSKYESPAVIRKAEIDLDKVRREYTQALSNYNLKVQQAQVNIRQKNAELQKLLREKERIIDAVSSLTIKAPASGMIVYHKDRDGTKRTVGSMLHLFRDPTVATLPDLSSFNSITYVNEIDISKVKQGQLVTIGIDAFPEKKFPGKVLHVANIGEQLPNTDSKVFEVQIQVNETDPVLRPAMTTSNAILTRSYDDVLYVPLEAVHSNDSLTFVYCKNNTRQLVLLGDANENAVIIEKGLSEGDRLYLSVPEDADDFKWTGMDLYPLLKEKKMKEELEKKKIQDSVPRQHPRPPFRGSRGN
ncbi:MAG: efflux RND transporter periplasmic adaptor subunit [Bacteroidales bacterium]|nr:efflux RND transporter periplasmic adaptor subunit [Bacteroidales bacterium]